jgi:hypothetical protein
MGYRSADASLVAQLEKILAGAGLLAPKSPWQENYCQAGYLDQLLGGQAWGYESFPGAVADLDPWMMHQQQWLDPSINVFKKQTRQKVNGSSNPRVNIAADADAERHATTAMIRNIPNRYTRSMLIERLNEDFFSQYDFLYLPMDFKNKSNLGYAFINFRKPAECQRLKQKYDGVETKDCFPLCKSTKPPCEVSVARIQGQKANVKNLQNSPALSDLKDHPDWQPLLFDESGKQLPFPMKVET